MRSKETRSGTSPAWTPVGSLVTIWLSGMVVSSILSGGVEFQRSTRWVAALTPLARTHMVIVSAKAASAKADEATSTAASAPHVLLMVITLLPALIRRPFCLIEKARSRIEVRKAFPNFLARASLGGKADQAGRGRRPSSERKEQHFH